MGEGWAIIRSNPRRVNANPMYAWYLFHLDIYACVSRATEVVVLCQRLILCMLLNTGGEQKVFNRSVISLSTLIQPEEARKINMMSLICIYYTDLLVSAHGRVVSCAIFLLLTYQRGAMTGIGPGSFSRVRANVIMTDWSASHAQRQRVGPR